MKNVITNARTSMIARESLKYIHQQNKANINDMEETLEYAREDFRFCLITEVAGNEKRYWELVNEIKKGGE